MFNTTSHQSRQIIGSATAFIIMHACIMEFIEFHTFGSSILYSLSLMKYKLDQYLYFMLQLDYYNIPLNLSGCLRMMHPMGSPLAPFHATGVLE